MEAQHVADDQSHYEISLTASQAFLAFVLLLLSLSASFAFGLVIGRGQADERLVVRREPAIVSEGSVLPNGRKPGRIVELGVENSDFQSSGRGSIATPEATGSAPMLVEEGKPAAAPDPEPPASAPVESAAVRDEPVAATPKPAAPRVEPAAVKAQAAAAVPAKSSSAVYAQLLSTGDQKRAEAMAARLIEGGFNSAYVERASNDKGPVYRVRVRFNSEAEARTAEPKLKSFSPDAWIDRNQR